MTELAARMIAGGKGAGEMSEDEMEQVFSA